MCANRSLERTQPERDFMSEADGLRRSARSRKPSCRVYRLSQVSVDLWLFSLHPTHGKRVLLERDP